MKRILILAALVFITSQSFSQFTIGPKIGLTMNKLNTDLESYTDEMKTGFQIGAFVRFGKKLFVQPEVMFATTGGKITNDNLDMKADIKLSTVQVPLLIGFRLLNLKVVKLNVMGGPAYSFVTNKELSTEKDWPDDIISKDNIKDGIWQFQLGGGVEVLMFTLDVRYGWGLNNMWEASDGGDSQDMKNNAWNISLGWKIL